jgi:DNA repair exonuclease SbcCD nuclease subunit
MLITLVGDMHISDSRPFIRNDADYLETCLSKFRQIVGQESYLILQAGDFFDKHKVSNRCLSSIISAIMYEPNLIACCRGQHDMKFHSSDYSDTALNVLQSAELVTHESFCPYNELSITICDWNQSVPKPAYNTETNILVIHKMIVEDGALYPGQDDFISGYAFLTEHSEYDLILSGDNHNTFVVEKNGRYLVNPGCMMRKTIDDVDKKPVYFTFDTETKELKQHEFKVDPNPFIGFDRAQKLESKTTKEEMMKLIEAMKSKAALTGTDFVENLSFLSKEQSDEVKQILQRSLET